MVRGLAGARARASGRARRPHDPHPPRPDAHPPVPRPRQAEVRYVLLESAAGYALFERKDGDEVAIKLKDVQAAVVNFGSFSRMVALKGFSPFRTAEDALANCTDVAEGAMNGGLRTFLENNVPLPKPGKKSKFALAVSHFTLGGMVQDELGISCVCNDLTAELLRGCRMHLHTFLSALRPGDLERAQLGLAHSYSRSKVKFDVNRADKHIIQSIAILDTLDKDINTFAMRVREWYSWHFPELVKIVNDNYMFARLVLLIKRRDSLSQDSLAAVEAITMDESKAQAVLDASRHSMGMDINDIDLLNVHTFAERVIKLAEYRLSLQEYLKSKMELVAPNLQALIGDQVGARLISHAGSLTNLAKYPASTVQILGAEKALFRALKTRGNTPKYGLIFHSSFIGRAAAKNKGRISRYLANKCSIASRIDNFSETPTNKFGERLREQVEERLRFYDSGEAPRKNIDVMKEVMDEIRAEEAAAGGGKKAKKGGDDDEAAAKKAKKAKKEAKLAAATGATPEDDEAAAKAAKKAKKEAKRAAEEAAAGSKRKSEGGEMSEKKKKKKDKGD
jgi:nucleolar protein 56